MCSMMDDATGCKPPLTQNDNISNVSISTLPNYDNSTSSELSSLPDGHPIFETWLAPSDTSICSLRHADIFDGGVSDTSYFDIVDRDISDGGLQQMSPESFQLNAISISCDDSEISNEISKMSDNENSIPHLEQTPSQSNRKSAESLSSWSNIDICLLYTSPSPRDS